MNFFRKVISLGVITAAAGIGIGALGVEVASAHANIISGTATCASDGKYNISWKIVNDFNDSVTVSKVDAQSSTAGTFSSFAGKIGPSVDYNNHPENAQFKIVTQTGIPGNTASSTLTVKGVWDDKHVQTGDQGFVNLGGTCTPFGPANVTFTDPTCASSAVSYSATPVAHVSYTVAGTVAAGKTITVTANVASGYTLAGQTVFSHTFPPAPTNCVVPVIPTVTTTSVCGAPDTFTAGPTNGVVYTPATGNLVTGNNVDVVTATPANGFVFTDGTTSKKFTLVGGPIEVCPTSVTPVAPNVITTTDCGVSDTFAAVPTTGVVYAPASGTLADGQAVVVVATPAAGYTFSGQQSVNFTVTGTAVEVCTTAVTPVSPTVTPGACSVGDTFTTGPTPGVVYTPATGTVGDGQVQEIVATPADGFFFDGKVPSVTFTITGGTIESCETSTTVAGVSVEPPVPEAEIAVAPPVPETPPLGLPETGTDSSSLLLLGGLALVIGSGLAVAARRRTA